MFGWFKSKGAKLAEASAAGDAAAITALIAAGADPDEKRGDTLPIEHAVAIGSLDAVRALLAGRARPTAQALVWAVMRRRDAIARELLDAGADPSGDAEHRPLHAAARTDGPLLEVLLGAGADPAARAEIGGLTALHSACVAGALGNASRLLAAGAPLDATTDEGETPLVALVVSAPGWGHGARVRAAIADAVGGDADAQVHSGVGLSGLGKIFEAAVRTAEQAEREPPSFPDGLEPLLREMVARGASLTVRDRHGRDLITLAREARFPESLVALLRA